MGGGRRSATLLVEARAPSGGPERHQREQGGRSRRDARRLHVRVPSPVCCPPRSRRSVRA
ncbi:hypothetical protein RAJCM14343_3561 [Rhodococcus aetherivorans]|uniref:Uncharacterized protein n=1 Tax=Rhodococcus aetherivorans TaxID=191292 RepID=A0ABQ0YP13_9NOCA|nr:hypothetical protein RAJCM14343_3561 [Rhodococcus aetherivorans]CCW12612.1 hypothetical protein EBESD8_31620 [Rhodococcus aetherivorans]